ncbi:hypothetical protein EKI59_02475 [Corynebacterium sanguinis]|uniref:Minor capsid protein n=1 Tax=Corynebacterium sanguinis TaxID=2594913 RepID=A0A6C1TZ01_9CORY|nr:hypothetical protein EKI59_02475 [Corynebacterium sanguinis]
MAVLTEDIMVEYRRLLREINRLAQTDLVGLWALLNQEDKDLLFRGLQQGVPEIVAAYRGLAADVSTDFYEMQNLHIPRAAVGQASDLNIEQLEESLRWAVYSPSPEVLGLVSGIVQKQVVDGSRGVGMRSLAGSGRRWVRAAHPGACAFCRMLATRGLDRYGGYSSKAAATSVGGGAKRAKKGRKAPEGGRFHANCMCVPVLADAYQVPDYVSAWEQEYKEAFKAVGSGNTKAILSEMRALSTNRH